jgi:hypothetical protein
MEYSSFVTCRSAPFHFLPHQSLVLRHCLTGVPKAHNFPLLLALRELWNLLATGSLSISVLKPRHVFKQSSFIYSKRLGLGLQGRLSSQEPPFPQRFEKLSTYERAKLLPCRRFNTVEKVRELPVPQTSTQAIMLPKSQRLVFYVHSRRLSSE